MAKILKYTIEKRSSGNVVLTNNKTSSVQIINNGYAKGTSVNNFLSFYHGNGLQVVTPFLYENLEGILNDGIPVVKPASIDDAILYFSDNFFLKVGGSGTTNASDLTSGTLDDARLSDNVVLKDEDVGTDRQVEGFVGGLRTPVTLGWKQLSDMPSVPSFSNGVLIGTAFQPSGDALFAFGELDSSTSGADRVPFYGAGGRLKVGNAVSNDEAISKAQFDAKIGVTQEMYDFIQSLMNSGN